ncbi:MAG: tRNA pseudouridine(55) synthase TruB [Bacteroidales bacterium]|jgi:tRNA pseudouridine55 synthase|nr:tRNA pseudouridine(55) synthase TruB [Bacteroidales bacterium]MDD4217035.1 tRNA pseudouridine(55) synthase TruB [Bacteroidales bacterium]MDY0142300.1 tRNA pseudouridine(55) synthase TruB [Bacteroidales bacterium]
MVRLFDINNTPDFEAGEIILIDKPKTWSSFDVVNKIRWKLKDITGNKKIKVGHAGTLDPLATGLLVICTGKATKTIDALQNDNKIYEAVFKLGETRPSFDMETETDKTYDISNITNEQIVSAVKSMEGTYAQTPPTYSAIQINGKRAYEFARKGEDVKLKSREINISKIEINDISLPKITLTIHCSKGTYIRSLADEFGKRLDNGAFLYYLRRIQSGEFNIHNGFKLDYFIDYLNNL